MPFQFAQDEDSYIGGFAVIEYETSEQTEKVREATDGMIIKGKRAQVSYCAPGAPGRSTLAALIAAQRMVSNLSVFKEKTIQNFKCILYINIIHTHTCACTQTDRHICELMRPLCQKFINTLYISLARR